MLLEIVKIEVLLLVGLNQLLVILLAKVLVDEGKSTGEGSMLLRDSFTLKPSLVLVKRDLTKALELRDEGNRYCS